MPDNAYQSAIALVEDKFAMSQEAYESAKGELANLIEQLSVLSEAFDGLGIENIGIGDLPEFPTPEYAGDKPSRPDTSPNFPTNVPEQVPASIINFDDVEEPSVDDLLIPAITITTGENEYNSALLTAIQHRLQTIIEDGGIALPVDAEDQWFNREFERSQQAHLDSIDRVSAEWSKRGLPIPDDFLGNQITTLDIDFKNKRLDIGRDIALKQYELADQNTRFALEKGIQLEDVLTRLFSQIQDRLFQASKAYVDAQVAFYNAQLQKYAVNAQIYQAIVNGRIAKAKGIVDIYVANVSAYRAQIEAEAARLESIIKTYMGEIEAYKGEIQAQALISELNIKVVEAQIRSIIANTEIALKNAELQLKALEVTGNIKVESLRSLATVMAQQVAGAWAAVHASASISGSGQTQTSTSYVYQHNYEE